SMAADAVLQEQGLDVGVRVHVAARRNFLIVGWFLLGFGAGLRVGVYLRVGRGRAYGAAVGQPGDPPNEQIDLGVVEVRRSREWHARKRFAPESPDDLTGVRISGDDHRAALAAGQ